MTINGRSLVFGQHYLDNQELPTFLKAMEGFIDVVYDDCAAPSNGRPGHYATIGIGVNLTVEHYLAATLQELGVFAAYDASLSQPETPLQKRTSYQKIIRGFSNIIKGNPLSRNARKEIAGQSRSESALQKLLTAQLQKYCPGKKFELTEAESMSIKRKIIEGFTIGDQSAPAVKNVGKQKELDDILIANNILIKPEDGTVNRDTQEYKALMSLSYGSITFILDKHRKSNGLLEALKAGDRATAWFEIRYNTNGGATRGPGIAKRRYLESEMFGLYDDENNVSVGDAQSVFRMLQKNRQRISKEEALFGTSFDGKRGTWLSSKMTAFEIATKDVSSSNLISDNQLHSLVENLEFAKAILLADLRANSEYSAYPDITGRLQDSQIVSTNIYLNPAKDADTNKNSTLDARPYETGNYKTTGADDLLIGLDQNDWIYGGKGNDVLLGGGGKDFLFGGAGSDVLYGGLGNDILYGEGGSDVLIGGAGSDTYYYAYGEGNVRIIDDGQGDKIVIIDDKGDIIKQTKLGNVFKKNEQTNVWTDESGKIQITHHSPWQIVLEDGGTITLGDDFQSGDFGINLIDTPDNPETTLTITGDLAPIDFDPGTPGVQVHYDELGNVITDPGTPEPDRADTLYDSTGNDSIVGGGGNDQIHADNGGDDWLNGGSGSDGIVAGSGHDILEGGTGADLLFGGTEDDKLFAEDAGEMSDLVEAGEAAVGITGQGDLLSGGEGNDFLYGSDNSDALFGGAGSDLLVGGGGDDVILSAGDATAALFDWSYVIETSSNPNGGTSYSPVFTNVAYQSVLLDDTGSDVVYAGTGNDFVYTGNGDDEIYGGSGNDTVFGFGGGDFIEGGAGDDDLNGDNSLSQLAPEGGGGNDTYDIGSGIGDLTISDDGENFIYWGDQKLTEFYKDGDEDIRNMFDGKQQISHCSPWNVLSTVWVV